MAVHGDFQTAVLVVEGGINEDRVHPNVNAVLAEEKLTLAHVDQFHRLLDQSGAGSGAVSPKLLPTYNSLGKDSISTSSTACRQCMAIPRVWKREWMTSAIYTPPAKARRGRR